MRQPPGRAVGWRSKYVHVAVRRQVGMGGCRWVLPVVTTRTQQAYPEHHDSEATSHAPSHPTPAPAPMDRDTGRPCRCCQVLIALLCRTLCNHFTAFGWRCRTHNRCVLPNPHTLCTAPKPSRGGGARRTNRITPPLACRLLSLHTTPPVPSYNVTALILDWYTTSTSRDTGRLCQACFALTVALLGCGGLDALGELPPQLHARLRPLMRLAWHDGRNARLKVWCFPRATWFTGPVPRTKLRVQGRHVWPLVRLAWRNGRKARPKVRCFPAAAS